VKLKRTDSRITGQRWLWILILAVVGAAAFELLLALAWTQARRIPVPDATPTWALWVTIIVLSTALLWLLLEPIRIGPRQLRFSLAYPPIWVAVVIALAFVAVRRFIDPDPMRPAVSVLIPWWVVGLIALILTAALGVRSRAPVPAVNTATSLTSVTDTSESLISWADTERPSAIDLFGHRRIAGRLARLLSQPDKDPSIAIVGEFGSGKTTILRWIEADLKNQRQPRVIVSWISCWGFSSASSVAVHVISKLIEAVQETIDVTSIRGLPEAYRRMLAPEKLRPLERFLGSDHEDDILRRLESLPRLLDAVDTRLVLFIEDADRTPERDFDPAKLERLLWILKDLRSVTFVLALSRGSVLDVSKLCDHVEVIPQLDAARVAGSISKLRGHCTQKLGYIVPTPRSRASDPLELDWKGGTVAGYIRTLKGTLSPPEAIAQLLRTPRRLKHAIRRVHTTWMSLRGEVDINDLIIINVLREGASETLDFLIWNIDAARQETRDYAKERVNAIRS
jgi:hypothetical protein